MTPRLLLLFRLLVRVVIILVIGQHAEATAEARACSRCASTAPRCCTRRRGNPSLDSRHGQVLVSPTTWGAAGCSAQRSGIKAAL
jgi:hypothetical protein